ncbi:MAG: ribonuclease HII [Rickettsiales bacterium]|jgi:ribonuclease HII
MINATKIKPNFLIEQELMKSRLKPFLVAGIDEAGRGPLSGPVVASCVILNHLQYPEALNDSKKLSAKNRANIFLEIKDVARFGIGVVLEAKIDEINILNATKLAMKLAFEDLCQKYNLIPDAVIVDGNFIPEIDCPSKAIIKGDEKSLSIAAASIVAKETRDEIMQKLDNEFPVYDWKKNKGYPTKYHFEMINKFGTCKYHRQSFNLFK